MQDLPFNRHHHPACCQLRPAYSLTLLSCALSDFRLSRLPLLSTPNSYPAPSLDGSSSTERTPRHQPQECTFSTKILISRVNHHPCVQRRGRSEHRLSGCLITCGLCIHVDPLFGEKEAIFEDVLCALRLKYGNLPFSIPLASAGRAGEEIKNLSLRLLHYKREKPFFPLVGYGSRE